jgi:hypothetical protein
MPSLRVHCAVSRERTGFDFKELHEWIDALSKELGMNHRTERHAYNLEEEKKIAEFWNKKGEGMGEKAVVEWLFHIALDNIETAFKRAKKGYRKNNIYNFFKFGLLPDSKFIYFDFDKLSDEELKEEFKEAYKDEE